MPGGVIIALEKGGPPKREVASGPEGGTTVVRDEKKPEYGDDDERMDVYGEARIAAAEGLCDLLGVDPMKAKELDGLLKDYLDNC
jgi:hypothetical protein